MNACLPPRLLFAGLLVLAPATTLLAPPEVLDFGDAPDGPYPTLLASDGARHVDSGPMLGTSRDTESDGQPDTQAAGDDSAGPANDDEDGIAFSTILFPGFATNPVTVTVSGATSTTYLNAWMDFDGDGDWTGAGEQIFTDRVVVNGANSLTFAVPAISLAKTVYSRWRISTTGGLNYTGRAEDGEVEDYCHGSIHGRKWLDRNANGLPDPGEPGLNGQRIQLLDASGSTLIAYVDTHDMDLDGTPGIDPATESGIYGIHGVPDGDYVIRDFTGPDSAKTFPALFGPKDHRVRVACRPVGRTPPELPPVCGNVTDWVEFCTPGTEQWFSFWILSLRPSGSPSSPLLELVATGDTVVQRGAPMNPGVGTASIPTEILSLDLRGTDSVLGGFGVRGGATFGTPTLNGGIHEHTRLPSGDFQVDSFFDIWTEISVDGGQTWSPASPPDDLQAMDGITQTPPIGAHFASESSPVELQVKPGEDPSGYDLVKIDMIPLYGIDFGQSDPNAERKAKLEKMIRSLRARIDRAEKATKLAKRRGQSSKVRRFLSSIKKFNAKLRRTNRTLHSL